MPKVTYKRSGVDIDEGNRFVKMIKPLAEKTNRSGVCQSIGGFGALFKLPNGKYKNPVMVSSTDGVGTKLKLAIQANRLKMLGVDLVAMNVNDIITCGAEPLFFLDYLAVGKLKPDTMKEIIEGIVEGCQKAHCALIGGETAEMPGVYREADFDLAGFAVGVVDEGDILNGTKVKEGDCLVGCASNGLHSNGFSLVRKVFNKAFVAENVDDILKPTRIYVKAAASLLKHVQVHAMAHITGGGFIDNIPRALPEGLGAVIHTGSWKVPRVFKWIQEKSKTSFPDMYRTFNMGVGFVFVISKEESLKALSLLEKNSIEAWVIGHVTKGKGVTIQ